MWDVPGPGLKPVSPALASWLLTTVPPGKPLLCFLLNVFMFYILLWSFWVNFCIRCEVQVEVYLFLFMYLFIIIYFWLRWVFIAVCRLSLVAYLFIFACECPIVPTLFVEKTICSPLNCFCNVEKQLTIFMWLPLLYSLFCSIDLCVCAFVNTTISLLL